MKEKAENSRGRGKYELTQAYKIICWLCIPDKQTRRPRCENAADSVLCTPTNDVCKLPNWKCVLRKCTVCHAIALPEVEMDTSIRAPMIMFNTYMTQFTCSHHGILILEKSPLIWMQKENLKELIYYLKILSKSWLLISHVENLMSE